MISLMSNQIKKNISDDNAWLNNKVSQLKS